MTDFGFYLVMTQPVVGYAKCAEAAVRAEVPILQLRMKEVSREELIRTARLVRHITQGSKTTFILLESLPDYTCHFLPYLHI